ncbi:MAG TPA: hypothetical protein VIF82_13555 [Burkholderiaceae bacterium]|jgi:hypothetical protein
MIETFTISSGESFDISTQHAVVVDNVHSESVSIHSSGGGGHVGRYGGHVSAPTVHSRVIEKQRIWVKTEQGAEVNIDLTGANFPTRAGHRVAVTEVRKSGTENWQLVSIKNETTSGQLKLSRQSPVSISLGRSITDVSSIFTLLLFSAGAIALLGNVGIGLGLMLLSGIFYFVKALIHGLKLEKEYEIQVEKHMAKAVINTPSASK